MLTVKGLNQFYGQSHTLWDLDLNVEEGKCTCLMGRNGVGKTTLLQCVMGLLATQSGQIEYLGQDIAGLSAEHVRLWGSVMSLKVAKYSLCSRWRKTCV